MQRSRSVVGRLLCLCSLDGDLVARRVAVARVAHGVSRGGVGAVEPELGGGLLATCRRDIGAAACLQRRTVVYPQLVARCPVEFHRRASVFTRGASVARLRSRRASRQRQTRSCLTFQVAAAGRWPHSSCCRPFSKGLPRHRGSPAWHSMSRRLRRRCDCPKQTRPAMDSQFSRGIP